MSSIYDKASLVLIPSGTKTSKVYSQVPTNGDGDFTFSRSTAATRVNASGNIEKETQNLLTYSNTFDQWSTSGTYETGGQSGYDGSNDAWLLSKAANSYTYSSIAVSGSGVMTYSVYAKQGSIDNMTIYADHGTASYLRWNLNTNAFMQGSNMIDYGSVDVGGGWYRVWFAFNAGSLIRVLIYPDFNGTTAGDIYIQDAQLEQGLVARDYIETTTTAIYGGITDNVPRLDYTDSSCPALLLEPQRSNLLIHSEYFESEYANDNLIINSNAAVSPEGVQNALSMVATTDNVIHRLREVVFMDGSSNYTYSVFIKSNGYDWFFFRENSSGSYVNTFYNLATGTTTDTGASIEDYGNGWYRCILSVTSNNTAVTLGLGVSSDGGTLFAGDGVSGLYIYGAQLEEGSYATSYIPTYGSAVTRNQDLASFTHDVATTSWSVFMDVKNWTDVLNSGQFAFSNVADTTNSLFYYSTCFGIQKSVGQQYACGRLSDYEVYDGKFAVTYDGVNTIKIYVDGVLRDTITTADAAKTAGIDGGNLYYAGSASSKEIKSLLVFPTALTDQEAIDLTTI